MNNSMSNLISAPNALWSSLYSLNTPLNQIYNKTNIKCKKNTTHDNAESVAVSL